jgi:hypothetical protein
MMPGKPDYRGFSLAGTFPECGGVELEQTDTPNTGPIMLLWP